jgi:hypothetical protein
LAARHRKGGVQDRGAILDAFCLATGYHRNYVIEVLRGRRRVAVQQRVARPAAPVNPDETDGDDQLKTIAQRLDVVTRV